MDSVRDRVIEFLNHPKSVLDKAYALGSLILIFVTVFQVALEANNEEFFRAHQQIFIVTEYVILFFFTADFLLRIIFYRKKFSYLFSIYGLVDLIAVAPGIIALFFPFFANMAWVRVLRIVRIGRAFKPTDGSGPFAGFNGILIPFIAMAIGFKALLLVVETYAWWPTVTNLGVVLGVVGFALAVLLGTKLRLTTSRLYAIEDAVCRIVGALRLTRNHESLVSLVNEWSKKFEATLRNPTSESIREIRTATDDLAAEFEAKSVGGPNIAGWARDVAFVFHRVTAETPEPYENFLKHVTFAYSGVVVLSVPGLTGIVMSTLVIYTLIGMYLLVEDIDNPLDYSENSLINADLEPLIEFNLRGKT